MSNEPPLVGRLEPDWRGLLPEIDTWINNAPEQDLDGGSLAIGMARTDAALALTEFCWPSYVVIDDMVFRGYSNDCGVAKAVAHWLQATNGDKTATERVVNHEHFWHLLQSSPPTTEAVMHWGTLVREMWIAKLARDFPERRFEVELHSGLDVKIMDHQITFWQRR